MNFYKYYKPFAFSLEPEHAHDFSLKMASLLPSSAKLFSDHSLLENYDMSLHIGDHLKWSSPVGLAAGLDKNGVAIDFFTQLNFGAVEVGTVTPVAQPGNPKPRMFRIKEHQSLLNRMGFNNNGSDFLKEKLSKMRNNGKPIGVNLGKNKLTSGEEAHLDYQKLYESLASLSDYLVINVSSPNTPGLRDLQNVEALRQIFESLEELRSKEWKPLFLKLSPDLNLSDVDDILKVCEEYKLYGVIVSNTTIAPEFGQGGVSGKLLKEKSRKLRKEVLNRLKGSDLQMIGVGGISSFEDVWDFWKSGGRAFQVYTAFIYQGPQLLEDLLIKTQEVLQKNQLKSVEELLENIDKVN